MLNEIDVWLTNFLMSIGKDFYIMEQQKANKEESELRMDAYSQMVDRTEEEQDGEGDKL